MLRRLQVHHDQVRNPSPPPQPLFVVPLPNVASAATENLSSQTRVHPSPAWRLRVPQPGTVQPRFEAPDQRRNIGRRPRPLFSSTLLPNSRFNRRPQASNDIPLQPRPQPLLDLTNSDLLPQIPPQPQPIDIPVARRNRDEEIIIVRNRAFDGATNENHHELVVNAPGGILI
jgi:hypothetical protein